MAGDDLMAWWKLPEAERVLQIVREVGVWRLANHDGCTCGHFSIRNVDVDVSCGKGRERGIWISSPSFDYPDDDLDRLLRPIAEEVKRQIEDSDGRGPITIHLHEWTK